MEHKTLQKRKPHRLAEYDYSGAGAYFVTICTKEKRKILSHIEENEKTGEVHVVLSPIGKMVDETIRKIPGIDTYVIMPNHVHMIIIKDGESQEERRTLSNDIRIFKALTTRELGHSIWQGSFYDHVIRNDMDFIRVMQYIEDNPLKWKLDEYYS